MTNLTIKNKPVLTNNTVISRLYYELIFIARDKLALLTEFF